MRLTGILILSVLMMLTWGIASADLDPVEQLGKDIFFDTALSTPPGQACAACHAPNTAFVGPVAEINAHGAVYPGAVHTRFGNRKPPSSAYASFSPDFYYDEIEGLYIGGMFWDGRALNTVAQAKGPFLNPVEMNNPNQRSVIRKIVQSEYGEAFQQLYAQWFVAQNLETGKIPLMTFDIGDDAFVASAYQFMAEAIAAYEASPEVNQFSSKYDAYLRGETTLTAQEMQGLELYEGKGMCNACHPSELGPEGEMPLFTDFTYDNLGLPRNPENPWYSMPPGFNPEGSDWTDYGLGGELGIEAEMGKFKVPTLRNVGMRPYEGFVQAFGHNGYFKSLKAIVHFYNTRDVLDWPAPEVPMNVNDDELGNLGLTDAEEDAIVAFLGTLTDGWMPEAVMAPAAASVSTMILGQALPNPFRGATRIAFQLAAPGNVDLRVYDVQGRLVRELIPHQSYPAGPHQAAWDAMDASGHRVAPGVYFYSLISGKQKLVQRVVLLP